MNFTPYGRPALLLAVFTLAPLMRAQNAVGSSATPPETEQTVHLDPFQVQADSDTSYGAVNSNSITLFNTELDRLPITADIFDQAFMGDTGNMTVEQMIETYSAGAGYSGSDAGTVAGGNQPADRNSGGFIQLRGVETPNMERDGFLPNTSPGNGYTTDFDIERIEIINGPQALLYGNTGAGGILNLVSKQARFGQPSFGSFRFQVDQYGNKLGQLDFGAGTENVAVRVAVLNDDVGARRTNIGGPLSGVYAQIAFKVLSKTIIRVDAEQTTFDRLRNASLTLTSASTSNDARNSQTLHYLLASDQIGAAAGGAPSGGGEIDNGELNWGNIDSMEGWWASELTVNEFATLTADTQWNSWLSTQLAVGYNHWYDFNVSDTFTYYAPNNTANPYPGDWTLGMTGSNPANDTAQQTETKDIRFSALATNDLFGGAAHSQSVIGADFQRIINWSTIQDYYEADSNWNVIVNPASTTNNGRTIVPKVYWPVNQGPVQYALWYPLAPRITYQGVNYVLQDFNPPGTAPVSDEDPLGVTLGSNGDTLTKNIDKGFYGANYTQWLNDRLDTLVGFRLEGTFEDQEGQGSANGSGTYRVAANNWFSFNAGADYKVLPWLTPYFSVSDSYDPPLVQTNGPYGEGPATAHAIGEEIGLKSSSADGRISGSISLFHVNSQDEEYAISNTLAADINPTGLNGTYLSPSTWINVNRESEGVQAVLTAAPTENWRLRASAAVVNGTIESTTSYGQLYNDQFHENSAGDVTYADGSIVYVNPTFNSKQLTVASTTTGAIPLTVLAMSTPGNAYYATPLPVTGQITSGSNVAKVLQGGTDPANPTSGILTGVTGLPISQIQINPALSGVSIPGSLNTSQAGDVTTGYPELSFNVTGVYTFNSGWQKGFEAGGSFIGGWKNRSFYYYPNGVQPNTNEILFNTPTLMRFDLILGYTRKLSRVTFSSQLNVYNIFNHYDIIILPNEVTGWSGPDNATFSQQPRYFMWTNTIAF